MTDPTVLQAQQDAKDKYRVFRNFMVNELGISRDDIEAWTKEAVAAEVQKLVGQMNLTKMAESAIRDAIHKNNNHLSVGSDLTRRIGEIVAKQIVVTVKPND